jgi:hypothetical protein
VPSRTGRLTVNISNAFLNGDLVEEVYMEQPDGFEQGKPGHVLWLWKSLYGLRQAPRVWNEKLDSALQEMGFTRVCCDKSIYVWEKKGIKVIVPVFVDDLTIVSLSKEAKDAVIKELSSCFKVHYLSPISLLLGVHITRDCSKRTMTLDQHQYILDLLDTFGLYLHQCSSVAEGGTPVWHILEKNEHWLGHKHEEHSVKEEGNCGKLLELWGQKMAVSAVDKSRVALGLQWDLPHQSFTSLCTNS